MLIVYLLRDFSKTYKCYNEFNNLNLNNDRRGRDMSIKNQIFNVIREDDENDFISNIIDGLIIALIVINVLLVILDTFNLSEDYQNLSTAIEKISIFIFTIEYILRLWTSDLKYPNIKPNKARFKHIFSLMALIDLAAILPFYLPFMFAIDLRVLRTLRIVRLFRIFKINRYTNSLSDILTVFKNRKYELMSSFFIVFLLMIISSVIMYSLENPAQPQVFSNALSGLWWAVATFTTVGYGDIYPITIGGKIMAGIMAILGIGLVAVPTGIISAGFIELMNHNKHEDESKSFCPYCGKNLN